VGREPGRWLWVSVRCPVCLAHPGLSCRAVRGPDRELVSPHRERRRRADNKTNIDRTTAFMRRGRV